MKGNVMILKEGAIVAYTLFSVQSFAQNPNSLPAPYSSTIPKNYVRSWVTVKPGVSAQTMGTELLRDVKQTTQYFDGLGRPLQTVIRQGSLETSTGANSDIVSPVLYDQFGREIY